jgi:putative transposase
VWYFSLNYIFITVTEDAAMPRKRRAVIERRSYHITHRCYNREFRFKFAVDRDRYKMRLFEMSRRYKVKILDYIITSNHVHLLAWSETPDDLSEAMRFLQGAAAQDYNRRKKRSGAFWSGRYNTTLIQDGYHLSRCLFYIGMNMVRAGVVKHPSEWKWSGFHEHMGNVERYRIIDEESLMNRLEHPGDIKGFRNWYIDTMNSKIAAREFNREPFWTEAVAVGDREWIELIGEALPARKRNIELVRSKYDQSVSGIEHVFEERSLYILKGSKRDKSFLTKF